MNGRASELLGRHCRSARSTGRFPDPRSCRRGEARRRSLPPTARLHSSHSEPTIVQGCIGDRDRRLPVSACTSHTMRLDVRNEHRSGDVFGLRRSLQTRKAMPLQPRSYALLISLVLLRKIADRDPERPPQIGRAGRPAAKTSGVKSASGFKKAAVARMRRRARCR